MPDSHLIDRLASLDAYPESAPLPEGWLDADLDITQQRSSVVTTLHEMKRVEPETPGRDWRPLAAVAAVILAVAAFVAARDDGGDTAESVVTTTTIAFDRDAAALATATEISRLLFTDDADGLASVLEGALQADRTLRFQADGAQVNAEIAELQGCENLDANRTVCSMLQIDDFDRAFGLDPSPWEVAVTYRNGTSVDVLQVVTGRPFGYESPPVVTAFNEWIGDRVAEAPECAGIVGSELLETPEVCWPFILDLAEQFKDSEAYDDFR